MFDGTDWTQLTPSASPPPRGYHRAVYDTVRQRVVLFGGTNGPFVSSIYGDTWEWDGNTWSRISTTASPPARFHHGMAFDETRGVVVVFSGWRGGSHPADTWLFDGQQWTQVVPNVSPPGRDSFTLSYDPLRQVVLLFGGWISGGAFLNDTWEWNGVTWAQVQTQTNPPARWNWGLAHDGVRTVLFFGFDGSTVLGDMWALEPPPAASYTTYRQSCPGSAGIPTLALIHPPRVGQTFHIRLTGLVPRSYGFLCFTTDDRWWIQNPNLPLPIDLIFAGAPGCFVNVDTAHRHSTLMTLIDLGGNGTIDVLVGVPNVPVIMGYQFYNQFISLDPAANALGLATTNAGHGVVGI